MCLERLLWQGAKTRVLLFLRTAFFMGNGKRPLVSTHLKYSEEDKRATTNVQNGLVFFFLFSFILFYSLFLFLN